MLKLKVEKKYCYTVIFMPTYSNNDQNGLAVQNENLLITYMMA